MTFGGTLEYMAPEMMQGKACGKSVDWFSLGIVIFEILSGQNPFKGKNQQPTDHSRLYAKMKELLGRETELLEGYENKFSPEAFDLLSKLLRYDPEERLGCRELGAIEVKQHPFFSEIDFQKLERKELTAPFVPDLPEGTSDFSNFQTTFTNIPLDVENFTAQGQFDCVDVVNFPNYDYF